MKTLKLSSLVLLSLFTFNSVKPLHDSTLAAISIGTAVATTAGASYLCSKYQPKNDGTRKAQLKRLAAQAGVAAAGLTSALIVYSLLKKYAPSLSTNVIELQQEVAVAKNLLQKTIEEGAAELSSLKLSLEQTAKALEEVGTEKIKLQENYNKVLDFSKTGYDALKKSMEEKQLMHAQKLSRILELLNKWSEGSSNPEALLEINKEISEFHKDLEISLAESEVVKSSLRYLWDSSVRASKNAWEKFLIFVTDKENQEYAKTQVGSAKKSLQELTETLKKVIEDMERTKPVENSSINQDWTEQV